MSPEFPRDAVKPGTVGVLHSDRLVLVLYVNDNLAVSICLPDQPGVEPRPRPFITNPFISVEPVDIAELSEKNYVFVETHLPTGVEIPPRRVPAITQERESVTDQGDTMATDMRPLEEALTSIESSVAGPGDDTSSTPGAVESSPVTEGLPPVVGDIRGTWEPKDKPRGGVPPGMPRVSLDGKYLTPTGEPPNIPHLRRPQQFAVIHKTHMALGKTTRNELISAVKADPFFANYQGDKIVKYLVGHYIRSNAVKVVVE